MVLDYAMTDCKPEPGAFAYRLGGEEGLENLLNVFRTYAGAGVTELYLNGVA
jgi:hypothetical protein